MSDKQTYAKKITGFVRARWWILILWFGLAGIVMATLPDLTEVVSRSEQRFIPANYPSQQAKSVLAQISPEQSSASNVVVVLSRADQSLTDADRNWLRDQIQTLKTRKQDLTINQVLSAFEVPEFKEQFQSPDGKVEILSIGFRYADFDVRTQDALSSIKEIFNNPPEGTIAQLTGSAAINSDITKTSQEGLKKTELLTVLLVLAILLVVFRSPLAPLIPLLTIAASFMITRGLVAWAAEQGMPVSTFTESFLIAVLFGAGTDYCILIMQRFREELAGGHEVGAALIRTMRAVTQTVVFSGSTVLIAFLIVGLAQFGMYRSAVGVAIGMFVTILACITLTPALLALLGKHTFWPVKVKVGDGHGESKLWNALGIFSRKRAGIITVVFLLVTTPMIYFFDNNRSFDDLAEIDASLGSVQGFETVKNALGEGNVFPVTVAIRSEESLRTVEGLAALERLSAAAASVSNVQAVRSATRPLGEPIDELQVPDLIAETTKGLGQLKDGVNEVGDGLETASKEINSNKKDVGKLSDGLLQLADGTSTAQTGLTKAADGLKQTSGGLKQSASAAGQLSDGMSQLQQTVASMKADLDAIAKANPSLLQDPSYLMLAGKQQGIEKGIGETATGTKQLGGGLQQLQGALTQIEPGVRQAANGLGQIVTGQKEAAGGVIELQSGLGEFATGLQKASDGLSEIGNGIADVQTFQQEIADRGGQQIPGFYIPDEVLKSDDFIKAMDAYISSDGKAAKIEVILSQNPYSLEAMESEETIRVAMEQAARQTGIASMELLPTGTTASMNELREISFSDFVRTGSLVLLGIYLVLVMMLRSLIAPLYIMLSLALNYGLTMAILEFIFVNLLGQEGLKWSVAFFVFLIIVALGVDYSIFLMARFKEEYRKGQVGMAMQRAMRTTGGVIISAAVIMGGTFSALMLAGMYTLAQIGAGIFIGLLIYAILFMGILVPALANLVGEGNFWPFNRKVEDDEDEPTETAEFADRLPVRSTKS